MPIAAAVGGERPRFRMSLLLAVAYAASIGGIATKIGSPTNSVFAGFVGEHLGVELSFIRYLMLALPFAILMMPIAWWVLWRTAREDAPANAQVTFAAQGSLGPKELCTAIVFGCAALLWIVSDVLAQELHFSGKHVEATVALVAAVVLIGTRSVSWARLRKLPFGTLVLMGGSFALAAGLTKSGLSGVLSQKLALMSALPGIVQIGIAALCTVALSAVTSNTATLSVMLNVLPRAMPVLTASALAASCDFALPAGTPPNAIVFATGAVSLKDMMRTGVLLDVIAVFAVTIYAFAWI